MNPFAVDLARVIAAPRSKVYRAWLDPALLAGWMGPDDFSVTVATVDERVGGMHEVEMLDRDRSRFANAAQAAVESPLGAGAVEPDPWRRSLELAIAPRSGGGRFAPAFGGRTVWRLRARENGEARCLRAPRNPIELARSTEKRDGGARRAA